MINIKVNKYILKFLLDLADNEDFVYEVTCKDDKKKRSTTIRTKDIVRLLRKMENYAHDRDIFISPFSTRYPERTSDYVFNRKMISSNSIVIDIDSTNEKSIDYHLVLKKLKEAGVPKPTYTISTGKGCHLWYFLTHHVGQTVLSLAYNKIKTKINEIEWPEFYKIDNLSIKQQFRMPFTINHKYNKITTIVSLGDKLKVTPANYIKPPRYTKKELKEQRSLMKPWKKKKKIESELQKITKIAKEVKEKKNESRTKFLEGSRSLKIKLKQKVYVCEKKLKTILKLLSYGESYLSCRVAGEALNISYKAAAKFLRNCVNYGYLRAFKDENNTAYSYEILVDYEIKKRKQSKGRCPIEGHGQSNNAMCKLAYQAWVFGLDKVKTVENWIKRFYSLTSGEHDPDELMNTYYNVYQKFEIGKYKAYGST